MGIVLDEFESLDEPIVHSITIDGTFYRLTATDVPHIFATITAALNGSGAKVLSFGKSDEGDNDGSAGDATELVFVTPASRVTITTTSEVAKPLIAEAEATEAEPDDPEGETGQ